jgi:hypothetical protein
MLCPKGDLFLVHTAQCTALTSRSVSGDVCGALVGAAPLADQPVVLVIPEP